MIKIYCLMKEFGHIRFYKNYRANQFDTNKFTKILINDFNWSLGDYNYNSGIQGQFLGKLKM